MYCGVIFLDYLFLLQNECVLLTFTPEIPSFKCFIFYYRIAGLNELIFLKRRQDTVTSGCIFSQC